MHHQASTSVKTKFCKQLNFSAIWIRTQLHPSNSNNSKEELTVVISVFDFNVHYMSIRKLGIRSGGVFLRCTDRSTSSWYLQMNQHKISARPSAQSGTFIILCKQCWRKVWRSATHRFLSYWKVYLFTVIMLYGLYRVDSRFASRQWEMSLQSNGVSHWLGANLESALLYGQYISVKADKQCHQKWWPISVESRDPTRLWS